MIDGRRRRGAIAGAGGETRPTPLRSVTDGFNSFGAFLVKKGVTADQVTVAGVVFAAFTAVAVGLGAFYLAVALLVVGGLMDTLDGVVAKHAGSTSARGAFFDSVADRLSDGLIFGGLSWYFLDGRHPKFAMIPLAILGVSAIVSYTRAKAESLGFEAKGGLMERAERLILLGIALVAHVVLVPLLITLLALTTLTAVGRFAKVWSAASDAAARPVPARSSVEARWRTWRDQAGHAEGHRRTRSRNRDLQPLATRLRGVLRVPESPAPRPKRSAPRRERATRSGLRRFETDH